MLASAYIEPSVPARRSVSSRKKAIQIAVAYALLSLLWVLLSSEAVRYFVHDPAKAGLWEDLKGCGFVVFTAGLLALILDRHFAGIRNAIQGIQDSEAKLHRVGDNLPNGYIFQFTLTADGNARFTYISAGVERVHGVTAAEVLGDANCLLSQLDPQEAPVFFAAVAASARDLIDFEMELPWRRRDEQLRFLHVRSHPYRGADGLVRWDGVTQDITERKRTEETLRLQSAALEAAANAIVITDNHGKIEWANRAFTTLTGYTIDEAIGRRPGFLKSGKHNQGFYQQLWRTILAGNVWQSEMVNRHKDGHFYTEEATITPVVDTRGAIRHFIAVKQDITARKHAELELEQSHQQMLNLSRQAAVAEFATSILHNVGNVLNSVGVASTCLADSLKKSNSARLAQVVTLMRAHESDLGSFFVSDPKGKLVPTYLGQLADKLAAEHATALEEIAQLQKSVEHIKAIITVQQDSAKGSGVSEPLNFTDLIEDALKIHSNAIARSQIEVIRQFDQVPPVIAEKHRVLQILVNLIRNAIQACEASDKSPKKLKVRLTGSDGRLQCAVDDSGIGISGENLQRLFTFGFTTKQGGHGFGLHGAQIAARDLGGLLRAQSDGPRCGATFILELPLHSTTPPDQSPQLAAAISKDTAESKERSL